MNILISRVFLMINFFLFIIDKSNNLNFDVGNLKFICRVICFFVSSFFFKILLFYF